MGLVLPEGHLYWRVQAYGHGGIVHAGHLVELTVTLFLGGRLGVRLHVFQNQTAHEDLGVGGWVGLVHIGIGKHVGHAVEDGILFRALLDNTAAGLAFVAAPVADPASPSTRLPKPPILPRKAWVLVRRPITGMPRLQASSKCLYTSSGQVRNRSSMMMASALSSACGWERLFDWWDRSRPCHSAKKALCT